MARSASYIKYQWLYLAFLVTLIAVLGYEYLPKRELQLLQDNPRISLFMDSQSGGTSKGVWLNRNEFHFRCSFYDTQATYKFCGFNLLQGNGIADGVDFTPYTHLRIKLHHSRNDGQLRLFIRNFVHGYSDPDDSSNTSKYLRILIPSLDFKQELNIPLSQFTLADWWLRAVDLPMEQAFPELDNVVSIGVDYPYPVPIGDQDIDLEYMRLEGVWISRDNWYLCIFAFWFVMLVLKNLQQYYAFRMELRANKRELSDAIIQANKLKEESIRYQQLSLIDQLTNTMNRRGVMRKIEQLESSNTWLGTSLILLDIDHFKYINDTYGHSMGDQMLMKFCNSIKEHVRAQDLVGRWGGEEFILVCPGTDISGATTLAEKIRAHVEEANYIHNIDQRLTVSIGVGSVEEFEKFEDAFRRVDRALYTAKNSGRNSVRQAEERIAPTSFFTPTE